MIAYSKCFVRTFKWKHISLWEGRILNFSMPPINGSFSVCYILKTDGWDDGF
jgi:hypothetical protein